MGKSEEKQSGSSSDAFENLLQDVARAPHVSPDTLQVVAPTLPAKGDVIDDKFEIDQRLGMGGMGAVFSATHVVTKKRVALKWMLPSQAMKKEAELRFIREAQVAGRIDHPNVVDVYDIGRHNNAYYLVMELLHGEPLSARRTDGGCSPAEAVALLMPVMRGVAAAHAQGVIHRDLKPANVFLCQGPDGSPRESKVLDFGISKLSAGQTQADVYATSDGTRLGTPAFMAPEQLREGAAVDHRVDIYALGVMLYELLTGRLPFKAQGTNEMIIEIAAGTPESLKKRRPELSNALVSVVMKAMARDPDDRYAEVRALALALEPFSPGVVFDQSGSDAALQSSGAAYATASRRRVAWSAVLLAVCALVAMAVWFMLTSREPAAVPVTSEPEPVNVADRAPKRQTTGPEKVAEQKPATSTQAIEPASARAKSATRVEAKHPGSGARSVAHGAPSTESVGRASVGETHEKRVASKTAEDRTDKEPPEANKPEKSKSRAGEFKVDDF